MIKKTINIMVLLVLGFSFFAEAQSFKTENSHVEFKSDVPLHSFVGSSDHLTGKINLNDSTVDFYIDVTTLDTGNNKRDKDMRQTLEADKYPFAEFFGKIVSEFDPQISEPQKVTVKGAFKIHNVSKDITVNGMLQQTPKGLQVEASWILDMTEFDIEPPGILFYKVDKEIDIQLKALLNPITEGI